jgi:hypothetical protein
MKNKLTKKTRRLEILGARLFVQAGALAPAADTNLTEDAEITYYVARPLSYTVVLIMHRHSPRLKQFQTSANLRK